MIAVILDSEEEYTMKTEKPLSKRGWAWLMTAYALVSMLCLSVATIMENPWLAASTLIPLHGMFYSSRRYLNAKD